MDKEALFAPRLPEDDVEIPGVGIVRVRGLSRVEAMLMQKSRDKGVEVMERQLLAMGMVDPPMTEAEIGRWMKACPAGELEPVTMRIRDLSGLGEGADKAQYKSVRGESDAGVRVLSGAEAGDDRGPDAAGDAAG